MLNSIKDNVVIESYVLPGFFSEQLVQDKKGKAAEKSPQEETVSELGSTPASLHDQIVQQGNRVRQLKSEKAAKVLEHRGLLSIVDYSEAKFALNTFSTGNY